MRVDAAPSAGRLRGQHNGASHEDKILEGANNVVGLIVSRVIDRDGLPGNHGKQIQVNPPAQQEGEIYIAVQRPAAVVLFVRLHRERGDHGECAQEENKVPDKRIRQHAMLIDLDVRPDNLSAEPQRTAESQKHPESVLAPVRRDRVHQECAIDEQRQQTLEDVSERRAASTRGHPDGHGGATSQQKQPGGREQLCGS